MFDRFIVYGIEGCPFCEKATSLLEKNQEKYSYIDLTGQGALLDSTKLAFNTTTVPIVLGYDEIEGYYEDIGGFSDLKEWYQDDVESELDELGSDIDYTEDSDE